MNLLPASISNTLQSWFGEAQQLEQQVTKQITLHVPQTWNGLDIVTRYVGSTDGLHNLVKIVIGATEVASPGTYLGSSPATLGGFHVGLQAVNVFADLNNLLNAASSASASLVSIAANACFAAADAACALSFANFLMLANTNNLAAKVGNMVIFGVQPLAFVANTYISTFILASSGVGFGLNLYTCITSIVDGDNSMAAYLSAIGTVAEVALRVYLLAAAAFAATMTGMMVTGALSLIAAGTAVYGIYTKCAADSRRAHVAQVAAQAITQAQTPPGPAPSTATATSSSGSQTSTSSSTGSAPTAALVSAVAIPSPKNNPTAAVTSVASNIESAAQAAAEVIGDAGGKAITVVQHSSGIPGAVQVIIHDAEQIAQTAASTAQTVASKAEATAKKAAAQIVSAGKKEESSAKSSIKATTTTAPAVGGGSVPTTGTQKDK